jgi:hypothetical protein
VTVQDLVARAVGIFVKKVIWPVSRFYVRTLIGDKPADQFIGLLTGLDFWCVHRHWPRLRHPQTFSEKTFHRMLFSRDPLLTTLSDKLASRAFIRDRVGEEYLVPLLWSGSDPDAIPFRDLPDKFVIKASHGCGYNIVVKDRRLLDEDATTRQLRRWLNQNFATDTFSGLSWAYKNISPQILIEPFIGEGDVEPVDYKFFCYDGTALFVEAIFDRFENERENFFDRQYNLLPVWNGVRLDGSRTDRPQNYDTMLALADRLSEGIDFIRVDQYSVGGRVFVGELTCYPAGGRAPFAPREYDRAFGEPWHLTEATPPG